MSDHLRPRTSLPAHAGHGGQPDQREQPVTHGGAHELAQLVLRERNALDPLEGTPLGGPGYDGHVAGHQPAPQRIIQCALDDEMDPVDSLR